jgi:hypothetical protein
MVKLFVCLSTSPRDAGVMLAPPCGRYTHRTSASSELQTWALWRRKEYLLLHKSYPRDLILVPNGWVQTKPCFASGSTSCISLRAAYRRTKSHLTFTVSSHWVYRFIWNMFLYLGYLLKCKENDAHYSEINFSAVDFHLQQVDIMANGI